MQNIVVMHVLNRMTNLPYHHPYFLLRERSLHLQVLVQITLGTQLHQEIKIAILDKNRIELHDVRVIKKRLVFDLPNDLH